MSYTEDIQQVESFLDTVRDLQPYPSEFVSNGMRWTLSGDVFPSTITSGTDVFTAMLDEAGSFAGSFCEIGSGPGVIGCTAALRGASEVVMTDINPSAVSNTLSNVRRKGLESYVDAYVSDLFEDIPASSTFDSIFWNVPWGKPGPDYVLTDGISRAVFDPGYLLQKRYITDSKNFLAPSGTAYIGTTQIGDIDLLRDIADSVGASLEIVESMTRIELPSPITYILLQVRW